ncbi:MAG: hypothetical protein QXJ74_05215 [Nitrososphaera sp.]
MSTIIIAPAPVTVGAPQLFPLFAPMSAQQEQQPFGSVGTPFLTNLSSFIAGTVAKVQNAIDEAIGAKPSGKPTPTPQPEPSVPPKTSKGGDESKPPGRPARLSDFKLPLKIAAGGAATAGAIVAVNEAVKQATGGENATQGIGDLIDNAVKKTGEYVDNASKSVGDALSPLLDPLGIKDPETKKAIGSLVIAAIVVGAIGLGLLMVMKK